MIETKERKIGELNISVTPWPARKAFKNQIMLGKVFGPSLRELGAAIKGATDTGIDSDADFSMIGQAFANLFEHLSESEAESVLKKLTDGVLVNNVEPTPEQFDTYFAGDMMGIYKVIGFVLEVNYGSFLEKSGIGALLQKKQTTQPPVPQDI